MKCLGLWILAVALLMIRGVDMEDLKAENVNLVPPHEHNSVLNRRMKGDFTACSLTFSLTVHFSLTASLCLLLPGGGGLKGRGGINPSSSACDCLSEMNYLYLRSSDSFCGCGSNSRQ